MKIINALRVSVLATASLLVWAGIVAARPIGACSCQELLDKSDLVVIATPTATNDTTEHGGLPGMEHQPVIGVETKFAVSAVLKGDKSLKDLVLHHYRFDVIRVPDGPLLVSFEPAKPQTEPRTFLLFLVREADGRYAPTSGQVDPASCGIYALGTVFK